VGREGRKEGRREGRREKRGTIKLHTHAKTLPLTFLLQCSYSFLGFRSSSYSS
jgi:hypothetical protein